MTVRRAAALSLALASAPSSSWAALCSEHPGGSEAYHACLDSLAAQYQEAGARSTSFIEKKIRAAQVLWIAARKGSSEIFASGTAKDIPVCVEPAVRKVVVRKWAAAYEYAMSFPKPDFQKAINGVQQVMTGARGNGVDMTILGAEHYFWAARISYIWGPANAFAACEAYEPIKLEWKLRVSGDLAGIDPSRSSIPILLKNDLCAIQWAQKLPGAVTGSPGPWQGSYNPWYGFGLVDPTIFDDGDAYGAWATERCQCQTTGKPVGCRGSLKMADIDYCGAIASEPFAEAPAASAP